MLTYILRRVGLGLTVMLATLVATFTVFFVGPADPAQAMCPEQRCSAERLEAIRENLGLNKPFLTQFGEYFTGLFVGRDYSVAGETVHCGAPCLGMSFSTRRMVSDEIFSRFPATLMLTVGVITVATLVGVTLGIIAAINRGTMKDRLLIGSSQVFGAIPYYVMALLFALYFTIFYPVFPQASGSVSDGWVQYIPGLIAPSLILGLVTATGYTRYTRNSMIETMSMDYVRTARSKGISEKSVIVKHGLRAALSPIVTILGLDLAALMSGTLVTEQIFGIDGIGRLAVRSMLQTDDLPVVMGVVLVTSALVVTMNIIVDIVYSFVDPRVRLT